MRTTNIDKLVKVKSIFDPNVITFKKASSICGRTRQFLNKQDLTIGIVLHDKDSGDAGIRVIVKDKKWEIFYEYCQYLDSKK